MLAKNEILQERYRIIRQLGHGGMGAVYEAIDEKFGEPIALKEIITGPINEKQNGLMIKAFEREAKTLAKARHEAIPYVRDYFSEFNRQFLVMELVEGEDLAEMLEKREKPFPLEDVLQWIDQLLDALDYLHNLKPPIIHRDIKPQNLKLSFRRKIKLLDFGIAKSGDKFSTITNQTFVGATLDYSPIEQILRVIDAAFREFILLKHKEKAEDVLKQNTDVRCDIYSVGATFYHLLTNHLPDSATKRTLSIWEDKTDPLPNPSQLNGEIPPSISDFLLKAMEIERENRFSSAIEMQKALQKSIVEERRRKKEKILPLIKPEIIPIVEEVKIPEQNLTQAVTEKLIPETEAKYETEKEIIQPTSSVPTEPLNRFPSETHTSYEITKRSSNTQPSENISKSELTEESYIPSFFENKEQSALLPSKKEETNSKPVRKMFWLLPTAALGILTVTGIGGIVWLSNSDSVESNKPPTNIGVTTPTVTPTIEPTAQPTISLKIQPSATPTQNKQVIVDNSKPKPAIAPKRTPIIVPNKRATSKPKKTLNLSDDCIYNGKCE